MKPNARICEIFEHNPQSHPLWTVGETLKAVRRKFFIALCLFRSKLLKKSILYLKNRIDHVRACETHARIRVILLVQQLPLKMAARFSCHEVKSFCLCDAKKTDGSWILQQLDCSKLNAYITEFEVFQLCCDEECSSTTLSPFNYSAKKSGLKNLSKLFYASCQFPAASLRIKRLLGE